MPDEDETAARCPACGETRAATSDGEVVDGNVSHVCATSAEDGAGNPRRRWSLVAALIVVAAAAAGCSDSPISSAPTTVDPPTTESSLSASSSDPPRLSASALGFGEVAFDVVPAGGGPATAARYCALLAENEQQRARGLMGFRDLAGYDAMLFRFASDTTGAFYMRNVPVGLSIAWFAADGRFVSSTDMAPCPDQDGCPTYAPAAPYRLALEVLEGALGRLGVTEGSVLTVGGACTR